MQILIYGPCSQLQNIREVTDALSEKVRKIEEYVEKVSN
jgi:cell division protein ZapA (FtsZ GTPase activity inhibitor)